MAKSPSWRLFGLIVLLAVAGARCQERDLKETYMVSFSSDNEGSRLVVDVGNGPREIANSFSASPAHDEVAAERAAAAVRAEAAAAASIGGAALSQSLQLVDQLLSAQVDAAAAAAWQQPDGYPVPQASSDADADAAADGGAEGPEPASLMLLGSDRAALGALRDIGVGGWASAAFDAFARETASLLDALEAQQQRLASAVVRQQAAAAAAALPPRAAALLAARLAAESEDGGAAAAASPPRPLRILGLRGSGWEMYAAGVDAAAAAASDAPSDYEDYDFVPAREDGAVGIDQVLVWVLSFVCAFTFVAFVHSLVQLRAVIAAARADEDCGYAPLPGADDGGERGFAAAAARGAFMSGGGVSRRGAGRRGGSGAGAGDGLDHPLLVDDGDAACAREIAGAQVLVVGYERDCCAKDAPPAAAAAASPQAQAFANECYQPLLGGCQ